MKKKIIILSTIVLLLLLSINSSFAKYAYEKANDLYLESHKFYFESDKLGYNKKYTDTLWDGNSVHFNLMNNIGNRVTDTDIKYEVKCKVLNTNAPCYLNGTDKDTITATLSHSEKCINKSNIDTSNYNKTECELNGYEWKKTATNQDLYFDVDSDNANVLITATSISPYKKELTATFNLIKNISDNGSLKKELNILEDSANLVITNNYEEKKCVLVKFNNKKSLVDTNDTMYDIQGDEYINSFKINIDGKSTEKVTFYSQVDNDYNIDDYSISVSNGCN